MRPGSGPVAQAASAIDITSFRPRRRRDVSRRGGLPFGNVHAGLPGLGHCRSDFRLQDATGKPRRRTLGVDDRAYAQFTEDVRRQITPSRYGSPQPFTTPSARPLKNSFWAKVNARMPGVTTIM